jgi:hypothetical protein
LRHAGRIIARLDIIAERLLAQLGWKPPTAEEVAEAERELRAMVHAMSQNLQVSQHSNGRLKTRADIIAYLMLNMLGGLAEFEPYPCPNWRRP